ncbi:MAG: hypothetical protein HRT38_19375 [Alteromonadaceae bacterium]|nr:hypothetical protein [Alteromonadaceae bacterium]
MGAYGKSLIHYFCKTFGFIWLMAFTYSYFWGKKKFIRTFKEVERSSLANCKDGELVRIQGKLITLGLPLVAPFSAKQCSAFETRASRMEEVVTAKGSGSHVDSKTIWETIKVVKEISDFFIQCGDSYALVRANDCQLKIHEDTVHDESSYAKDRGGFLTESENTKRQDTLERMGLSYRNYIGVYAADIKFEEGILEPREQVAVRGEGKWIKIDSSEEFQFLSEKGVEKVFEIKSCADTKLYISDSVTF